MIPLDEQLRLRWLFSEPVHEGCDWGGNYERLRTPLNGLNGSAEV